eukprot:83327-Lingulodinium_polyedra.AAC.1
MRSRRRGEASVRPRHCAAFASASRKGAVESTFRSRSGSQSGTLRNDAGAVCLSCGRSAGVVRM